MLACFGARFALSPLMLRTTRYVLLYFRYLARPGFVALVGAAAQVGSFMGSVAVAAAPATVVVETVDGQALSGLVDSRTDERHLWLRRETATVLYAQPVAWDAIASATLDGGALEREKLQQQAASLVVAAPEGFLRPASTAKNDSSASASQEDAAADAPPGAVRQRIRGVAVDSWLYQLDRRVEPDGIAVCVAPLTEAGAPASVRGSLTARLVVARVDSHTGRHRYENAQRWTRPVKAGDFVDGVACFRLPFRRVAPEHDLQLRSQALLHVRLSVAGHGNYEASTGVAIRPLHPFRDSLQLDRGTRFVENEVTAPVDRARRLPTGHDAPAWTPYHVQGVSF